MFGAELLEMQQNRFDGFHAALELGLRLDLVEFYFDRGLAHNLPAGAVGDGLRITGFARSLGIRSTLIHEMNESALTVSEWGPFHTRECNLSIEFNP